VKPPAALRAHALPRDFGDRAPNAAIGCKPMHFARNSAQNRAPDVQKPGRFERNPAARKQRRAQRRPSRLR